MMSKQIYSPALLDIKGKNSLFLFWQDKASSKIITNGVDNFKYKKQYY